MIHSPARQPSGSARANPIRRLVFFDPLRITIGHQVQLDVVLEQRLDSGEHQQKLLRRIGRLFDECVSVPREAGIRDADERRALFEIQAVNIPR